MGLDWCVQDKVREGKEAEHAMVAAQLAETPDGDEEGREMNRRRLRVLSICPGETLRAPRIGHDDVATKWFYEHMYQENRARAELHEEDAERSYWMRDFEDVIEEHKGRYVIALTSYAKSTVTGIMDDGVGFRGKVVGYSDFVSEALKSEAYEDHNAEATLDYGRRLQMHLCEVVRDRHVEFEGLDDAQLCELYSSIKNKLHETVEEQKPARLAKDGACWEARNQLFNDLRARLPEHHQTLVADDGPGYIFQAVDWLLFWSSRGHGFHAWY